jgi:hypothetical protein
MAKKQATKKLAVKPSASCARVRDDSEALAHVSPDDAARDTMLTLAREFPPSALVVKLNAMLEATESYTSSTGKVITRPNWTPRAKALELLLAYIVGRPIERQQIIKTSAPATLDDLMAQAEASPVFLESLLSLLNHLKAKRGGQDEKA